MSDPIWDEIYEERTRRGWSARELGRRAGVAASAIDRAETGSNATLATTRKALEALGLDLAVFSKVTNVDGRRDCTGYSGWWWGVSTDERHDAATVELVASQFREFLHQEGAGGRPNDFATEVLDALADAGLLLPPGGEKITRVGHWSPNRGYLYECGGHNDECPWPIGGTFVETQWTDGSRHMTWWTEVPDDPS